VWIFWRQLKLETPKPPNNIWLVGLLSTSGLLMDGYFDVAAWYGQKDITGLLAA